MTVYANFFLPQTVAMLFCLHENCEIEEGSPSQSFKHERVSQFIIRKILQLSQASQSQSSGRAFEQELLRATDEGFLNQYRQAVAKASTFNEFYRKMSNILKTLRSLRNNKLEQGNLIDFLVRRMYIYFEKLDFKEIVQIYETFKAFMEGEASLPRKHEFMLTKSIEELKFNLENYCTKQGAVEIASALDQLAAEDHTFKSSYLQGILRAQQQIPVGSTHAIHRYFDRCLGNLFQEKTQASDMSNKINHCILSSAYTSLKMGHLEQCLQAVSQGLRISQNNTDQESINNCIIYLYKVAQQLGRTQEEILLTQHAITHSLNLSNNLLMVYSCLTYSGLEKFHDCHAPAVALLKTRHITWTDAMHFSRKKIYSNFESNCKNIYHSHRSLLIPIFMLKLSVLLHLPQLEPLLLNPYFQRSELAKLEIAQQYRQQTPFDKQLQAIDLHFKLGQRKLLTKTLKDLKDREQDVTSPLQLIKLISAANEVRHHQSTDMNAFRKTQQLLSFCKETGFVKLQLIRQHNLINRMLLRNGLYYDALIRIEETLRLCENQQLPSGVTVCELLKCQVYLHLDNFEKPLQVLQTVQQSGQLHFLGAEDQILFYESKHLLAEQMQKKLSEDPVFVLECDQLKQVQQECLEAMLRKTIEQKDLKRVQKYLQMLSGYTTQAKAVIEYCQRVGKVYSDVDYVTADDAALATKVMRKIQCLYFDS